MLPRAPAVEAAADFDIAPLNRTLRSGVYMDAVEPFGSVDDATLVKRAREGDREAFGILVDRYMRPGYAVALSVTRRHEDAEDAVQESFLTALERLDECRNPERFAAWFLTIVRNRSKNLIRRETLRATDALPTTKGSDLPGPDKDTETAELRARLESALAVLTEVQREIVLLHDFEGWKHREIAESLDLPAGTVRSHLHHARKAMREALGAVQGFASEEDGGSNDET